MEHTDDLNAVVKRLVENQVMPDDEAVKPGLDVRLLLADNGAGKGEQEAACGRCLGGRADPQ